MDLALAEEPICPFSIRVGQQKVESASGGSLVDVAQATVDRSRDHVPLSRQPAGHGSLQTERSMGRSWLWVADELGQHRPEMRGAEREEVVEALAA